MCVARARATEIKASKGAGAVVLLGARVSGAFGFAFEPFTVVDGGRLSFAILPHPSGRSRGWLVYGAYARAREVLAMVGVR
jgi:hypothetical protein